MENQSAKRLLPIRCPLEESLLPSSNQAPHVPLLGD